MLDCRLFRKDMSDPEIMQFRLSYFCKEVVLLKALYFIFFVLLQKNRENADLHCHFETIFLSFMVSIMKGILIAFQLQKKFGTSNVAMR